ncbi:MAG: DUF4430 domain-containing protein [Clostridia bacterium]|nr:DUF4430 domain-containing protein [Clostridia bacterium]
MKSVFKSVIAIMLAAALLFAFAACNKGGSGSKQNEGSTTPDTSATVNPPKTATPTLRPDVVSITYTIDATAAYSSGKLSIDVMKELVGKGLLVNKALVTVPKDTVVSSTFGVFSIYGVEAKLNSERDVTIQGISNGDCGENSRWILKINDIEVEGAFDSVTLKSGDVVVWVYVIG